MKYLFFISIALLLTSGVYSQAKKTTTPTKKTNSTSPKITVVDCLDLSDNIENYVGKKVASEFFYNNSPNGYMGLKKNEFFDNERSLSVKSGFYDENEDYYTRKLVCVGGVDIYARIPRELTGVPNISDADYIIVVGKLIDRHTIKVDMIKRSN